MEQSPNIKQTLGLLVSHPRSTTLIHSNILLECLLHTRYYTGQKYQHACCPRGTLVFT